MQPASSRADNAPREAVSAFTCCMDGSALPSALPGAFMHAVLRSQMCRASCQPAPSAATHAMRLTVSVCRCPCIGRFILPEAPSSCSIFPSLTQTPLALEQEHLALRPVCCVQVPMHWAFYPPRDPQQLRHVYDLGYRDTLSWLNKHGHIPYGALLTLQACWRCRLCKLGLSWLNPKVPPKVPM